MSRLLIPLVLLSTSLPLAAEPLSGSVVDSLGRAVADIEIQILTTGSRLAGRTRTDADGLFTVDVDRGQYRAVVRYFAGGIGGTRRDVQLDSIVVDGPTLIAVVVPPVFHVRGRVTDETGQPVSDLRIRTTSTGGPSPDEDGFFDIMLLPGEYELVFVPNTDVPLLSRREPVVVHDRDIQLDVQLQRPWIVTGVVRDTDGQTLPDVFLVLSSDDLFLSSRADRGAFTLLLPQVPATYTLEANFTLGGSSLALRHSVDIEGPADLVFEVDRGRTVTGTITDDTGQPVASARVVYSSRMADGTVVSDEEGHFRVLLADDEPAVLTVTVTPPAGSLLYGTSVRSTSSPGDELSLVLASGSDDAGLFGDETDPRLPPNTTSMFSMDAVSADIDDDGDLDLIVAGEFANNVLLINDGGGHFADGSDARLPRTRRDSEDILADDVDGDGDLDLLIVSEDDQINEFYLNDGSGTFSDDSDRVPVRGTSNAVAGADIDGDGDTDVAIGNGGPGGQANALLRNDGGTYVDITVSSLLTANRTTQDIEFGDIDGDGDVDWLEGNEEDNRVLLNDGTGGFQVEWPVPPRATVEETRDADFGDIDGDGDLDILFGNVALFLGREDSQNRLLLNEGDHLVDATRSRLPVDGDSTFDIDLVDLDGDGDPDLATANALPRGPYRAYLNDGGGVFRDGSASTFPAGLDGEGFDIEAADYDGDGRIDLYMANRGGTDRLLIGQPVPTAVTQRVDSKPRIAALHRAFPNPFNSSTVLPFDVRRDGPVTVRVFDVLGQMIRVLHDGPLATGSYRVIWNGFDDAGRPAASGVYFVQLSTDARRLQQRLLLLR